MESLIIKETIVTPKIVFDFDNRDFELAGCSRPEDVKGFFAPIIKWLVDFKEFVNDDIRNDYKQNPIVFKFRFDYFNSSSAKFILDILVLIDQIHGDGLNMQIDWFYDENDDDMKEVGEELSDVVDFPFKYVVIK